MKKNVGFTIVELLIYMAILSSLLVIISGIFSSALDVQLETEASSGVDQDVRFIYNTLMYDMLRADNITVPAALGDISNTLSLQIGGTTYIYSLDGANNLMLSNGVTANQLNSIQTEITNVQFQRLGNVGGKHSIRISYTVKGKTANKTGIVEQRQFQTAISLR